MAKKATPIKNNKNTRILIFSILFALIGTVTLAVSYAAPGNNNGKGSGKGGGGKDTAVFFINEPAPYNNGDIITFTVETTATDKPFSRVECFKNDTLVYSSTAGHFQLYYDYFGEPDHQLSSLAWSSGPADCVASLFYTQTNGRQRVITSFKFQVEA